MNFYKSVAIASIITSLLSQSIYASCAAKYKKEGIELHNDRSNTIIYSGMMGTLVGFGISQFPEDNSFDNDFKRPSTYVLLGGVTTVGAGIFAKSRMPANQLYKTGLLLEQAQSGSGEYFDRLVKKTTKALEKKSNISVSSETIRKVLIDAEEKNIFCITNQRSSLKEVQTYVINFIANEELIKKENEKRNIELSQLNENTIKEMMSEGFNELEDGNRVAKSVETNLALPK